MAFKLRMMNINWWSFLANTINIMHFIYNCKDEEYIRARNDLYVMFIISREFHIKDNLHNLLICIQLDLE